ncbi:MAG TPA: hypothetical protein VFO10_07685 [Oligoflexus sp.]|uniref:hypothetical protein n=1 Tax=Oligoflexus sp. TaxID=1971216 RepID=UPI002D802587|nr:hypothetical protein [Oligoflexus sp.]HET9237115.1 hypothetical protein [Oligoflexus sp.]
MDSKKLGMFAAAALTVLASQANAGDKKAAPAAAAKASGEMECVGTCAPGCGGKIREGVKDAAACKEAKGNWTAKAADKSAAPKEGKAHGHEHK